MTDALFETTMELKVAFDRAVAIYDSAMNGMGVDIDRMSQARTLLEIATKNFHQALYDTLELITDWGAQNNIYEGIKRLVDNNRMFNGEFRSDRYNQNVSAAPNGLDGFRVIQFLPALKEACSWFEDSSYRLRGFRYWYEQYVLKQPVKYPGLRQGVSSQAASSQHIHGRDMFKSRSDFQAELSDDAEQTNPIEEFIIKKKDKVLKFINNELSRCNRTQGKLVAMLIVTLCDGGYFVHHRGKTLAMINAFQNAYPGKVATKRGI